MTPAGSRPGDPGSPRRRRRLYEPIAPEEPRAAPEEPPAAPPPADAAGRDTPAVPQAAAAPVAAAIKGPALIGKQAEASLIVKKYVYWSVGLGLVAVPGLSTAAILGMQIKMVADLAELYRVPFSRHRAKAVIAALLGSLGTVAIGRPLLVQALALTVPLTWPLVTAASATAASTMTYAIGRVFTQHFELGGTLLSFRPEETRAFFEAELQRAKG